MKQAVLLSLARDSINEVFSGKKINKDELLKKYDFLSNPQATFVTLEIDNRLRGCIGSIIANKTLLEDVIANAKSAAFRDSRFDVLTIDEFDDISISISVLTPPKEVLYNNIQELKSLIFVGEHGVILQDGNHQATFLPQVWESLNAFEEFFSSLCQKANLPSGCLNSHPTIYTYLVEKFA